MKEWIAFIVGLILFVLMRGVFRRVLRLVFSKLKELILFIINNIKRLIPVIGCALYVSIGCNPQSKRSSDEIYDRLLSEVHQLDNVCRQTFELCSSIENCNNYEIRYRMDSLNKIGAGINLQLDSLNQIHFSQQITKEQLKNYEESLHKAYSQSKWCDSLMTECPCSFLLD